MNPDPKKTSEVISEDRAPGAAPTPPLARREPVEHILHGDRRVDPYDWLRAKGSPEVLAFLEAENAYSDAVLKPTQEFQEKLYQEMRGRILETDLSVPYRLRGYLYFTKTVEGKQYPYHYRRRDPLHATVPGGVREGELVREELLLDLNQLAEGHSFLGLDAFEISDDSHWLAFSTDTTGFRQYTLYLKDLRTGETLPGRFERVTTVAWAADNQTLFYTVEDELTKRSYRLYRHILGSSDPDTLLYEESDERFHVKIDRKSVV